MTVHKFPQKSKLDKMLDALFQVLPANSHREIARGLGKQLGRIVAEHEVPTLLTRLRKDPDKYGWDVPHGKKGAHREDEDGYKFFAVLVDSEKERYFDPGQETQLRAGLVSTLLHAATSLENEAEAVILAAPYHPDKTAQKWLRTYARRMKAVASDLREVAEMLSENGG